MKTIPLFWRLPLLLWAVSHLFVSFSYASGLDFPVTPRPDPEEFSIQVQFTSIVDQLRLREAPGPDARVLATLPENTRLTYLHQTAGPETEVVLRGQKVKGRWRKVRSETNVRGEGWVFAGGLSLASVTLAGYEEEIPFEKLQFDFMRVKKISRKAFESYLPGPKSALVNDAAEHILDDHSFMLTFGNGHKKVIADSLCHWYSKPGEPLYDNFGYLGHYPELGLYEYYSNCEHGEIIAGTTHHYVSKYDGSMQFEMDEGVDIAISPDNRWVANVFSGDCASVAGLEFAKQTESGSWNSFYLEWSDLYAKELVWTDQPGVLAVNFIWNIRDERDGEPAGYYLINLGGD